MFSRKKAVADKTKGLLEILFLAIICAVAFHIFWQLIAASASTDNPIIIDIANRFGLDSELSVPTWLTSMMALTMASLAWLIGHVQKETTAKLGWYLIAAVGLFVSIDEVSAIHELVLQALHILAKFGDGQSFLHNAWLLIIPFLLLGLVFSVRYLRKALPRDTFINLVIAGGVYLLGAMVFEYLSIPMDKAVLSYKIGEVVIEESLELLGLWLVIRALLKHISVHEGALRKKLVGILS